MKQFLYLDTAIVDSIIAQSGQGLVKEFSENFSSEHTQDSSQQKHIEGDGTVGGAVLNIARLEGEIRSGRTDTKTQSESWVSHEIVSKILHDAAFDIAIQNIELVPDDESHELKRGDYFKVTRDFDIIDFKYLENIFSNEGLLDFWAESRKGEAQSLIDEYKNNTDRSQRRADKFDENKVMKEHLSRFKDEYRGVNRILQLIKAIAPYERMLISSDGYLIPLEERFFRIASNNLGFKYGGEMTCVGMITNINDEKIDSRKSVFKDLQDSINAIFKEIFPVAVDRIYIADPIAIYYDVNIS